MPEINDDHLNVEVSNYVTFKDLVILYITIWNIRLSHAPLKMPLVTSVPLPRNAFIASV